MCHSHSDGPVILESPAYPLLEGDNVTLLCKKKHAHPNFTAEFYKNGAFIGISSTGKMMNPIVSKSDEGFYKCGISKTEESPESWLAVESKFYRQLKAVCFIYNAFWSFA